MEAVIVTLLMAALWLKGSERLTQMENKKCFLCTIIYFMKSAKIAAIDNLFDAVTQKVSHK